jgi:DNA polymerase-4
MSSIRTIIHLDLDAFFCAVEEQRDPSLRGKPFAVGGRPESRGVVASASYMARKFGVRSAIPMAQAVRLCPELLVVSPNFAAYRAASRQVMERLHALTPLVEQISIDEAFLDVTALAEPGNALAVRLQATIRDELALSCSLGVATNKLVAKVATDVGKSLVRSGKMPQAICVVPPGEEAAFLAPLPATALWGVGPKTAEKLAELGMHTIGDIAA